MEHLFYVQRRDEVVRERLAVKVGMMILLVGGDGFAYSVN